MSPWESSLKPIQALFRKILKSNSVNGKDLSEEELNSSDGIPSPESGNIKNRRSDNRNDENHRNSVINSVYENSEGSYRNEMGIGEVPESGEKRLHSKEKSSDSNTVR